MPLQSIHNTPRRPFEQYTWLDGDKKVEIVSDDLAKFVVIFVAKWYI